MVWKERSTNQCISSMAWLRRAFLTTTAEAPSGKTIDPQAVNPACQDIQQLEQPLHHHYEINKDQENNACHDSCRQAFQIILTS